MVAEDYKSKRRIPPMSQLIACRNSHGIVLAGDSKTLAFDSNGKLIEVETERLVQLSERVAILAGGAAEGVEMGDALKGFIAEEGLRDVQDIYTAAVPFLASEYEKFMRKKCEILPVDPLHHVHFILAGYSEANEEKPRMYLLWTKKKLPQLDGDEIGLSYTVPRRMGLEYKLNQLCKENAPLEEIVKRVRESIERLGREQEEVGPPFVYALITKEGFKKVA
jgi:20S proteasome alpha/beta subunit